MNEKPLAAQEEMVAIVAAAAALGLVVGAGATYDHQPQ